MPALVGNVLDRCIAETGYGDPNAQPEHAFEVNTTGQKRHVTPQIRREFKLRAAIEPIIANLKERHRNYLADAIGESTLRSPPPQKASNHA